MLRQDTKDVVSVNGNPSIKHLLHALHTIKANSTAMNGTGAQLFAVIKIFEIEKAFRSTSS